MSTQTVNLSANDVLEHLNLKLPAQWTVEAGELDTVCIDTPTYELGYIVTLNIDSFKGYSFTVHEFQINRESGFDYEQDDSFLTYDEVLNYIERQIECFK